LQLCSFINTQYHIDFSPLFTARSQKYDMIICSLTTTTTTTTSASVTFIVVLARTTTTGLGTVSLSSVASDKWIRYHIDMNLSIC
jgi:hypothetical protein